jgi:creatinine amidohydrolase
MPAVRFEELNTRAFEAGKFDKVIVPLGSCESHGDHLPFGMDALTAHNLSLAIANCLERVIVLPPMWFGMSLHYRHKPMCVSLSNDTTTRVIRETLESLVHWGFRRIIIVNGHDGNVPCLEIAARDVKLSRPDVHIAALDAYWMTLAKLLPPGTFEVMDGLGHGGEAETSIGLATIPQLVDMRHARGMLPRTDDYLKQIWNFDELTQFGATGDPTKATVQKGEAMVDAIVKCVVGYVARMEQCNWQIPTRDAAAP